MILSERLEKIIETVPACETAADVGCDHGYVSIELIKRGRVLRVTAADVNPGPLKAARENISAAGVSDRIDTALSDGLLSIDIPECIIISGMGGRLMRDILSFTPTGANSSPGAGKKLSLSKCRYLILSPQSEPDTVRRFLTEETDFEITEEKMVRDDGKFYVIIKAENKGSSENRLSPYKNEADFKYGKRLMEGRDEVFSEYLSALAGKYEGIISEMKKHPSSERAMAELSRIKREYDELQAIRGDRERKSL